MRRLLLATLLAAAATLLLLTLWRPGDDPADEDPNGTGDSQLFYLLEPGRALVLALGGEAGRVKLVALAQMDGPAAGAGAPEEVLFGFRARLLDTADAELWSTPIWLRSRITSGEENGPGEFPRRRAALVTGAGVLTDERVVELDLGAVSGSGGELRLEASADSPWPVLVRPLRRRDADDETSPLRLTTLTDAEREALAGRVGVGAWHALDPAERAVLATFRWQRMEASGARGRDYLTRRVVLSDVGSTRPSTAVSDPGHLDPGRAMALNLRGPADLELWIEAQSIEGRHEESTASVISVTQQGEVGVARLATGDTGSALHTLQIPAGTVSTVSVLNSGLHPLRVVPRTDDVPRGLFGGTTATILSPEEGFVLGPEVRRVPMFRLPADGTSLDYSLRGGALERLRIEARPVAGAGAAVQVTLVDVAGLPLEAGILLCGAGLSPYESVSQPGEDGEPGPAGLPTAAELWAGPTARGVQITADSAVDLRLMVPLDTGWDPLEVDPAYELETEGVTLRHEPQLDRRWAALTPDDLVRLQADGDEVFVGAQVRLEPVTLAALQPLEGDNPLHWTPASPGRKGHAWFPDGEVPRQRLLERWNASYGRSLVTAWPVGARTALTVGQPSTIQRPADRTDGGRLAIWLGDGALLGSTATLELDGRDLARIPLTARQIELPIGPIPEGPHQLTLAAPGEDLTALLDLPPGDAAAARSLYRERTVYRLVPGRPVRASVSVSEGADVALYVIPYYELTGDRSWPGAAARCRIRVEASGGRRPGTLVERTTPEEVEGSLGPIAAVNGFLADRSDRTLVAAEPVRIDLGDDLAGTRAKVSVERLDEGDPMWVRLVALGVRPQPRPAGTQWVEEVGHRQGAFAWADPFEPVDSLAPILEAELADPQGSYRLPSEGAREVARELGWRLAVAAGAGAVDALPALAVEAQGLGFELLPVRVGDRQTLVLRDATGDGRGLLLLRFGGTASRVILQAPHAFHDRHTGDIALDLWEASSFPALQLNTRHRYVAGRGEGGAAGPSSDLARRDDTWFHALMLGLLDALERPLVVQVHGFGRTTVEDEAVDVIVSGGAYPRPGVARAFADTLGELLPSAGVAVFPDDTELLGAQLNRQGRAVATRPGGAFLHVETGPELREVLRADAAARSAVLRATALAAEADDDAGVGGAP